MKRKRRIKIAKEDLRRLIHIAPMFISTERPFRIRRKIVNAGICRLTGIKINPGIEKLIRTIFEAQGVRAIRVKGAYYYSTLAPKWTPEELALQRANQAAAYKAINDMINFRD